MSRYKQVPILVNSYAASLDDAVAQLKHGVCKKLVIDFSLAKFFDCELLVRFKCLLRLAELKNTELKVIPPNGEIHQIALAAKLLGGDVSNHPKNTSVNFVPLQLIHSERNDFLFTTMGNAFNSLGPSSNWLPELFESVSELANNIFFHSGDTENSGWGYFHAQKYSDKDEVCISLCDVGVGFLESYRRRGLVTERSEEQLILDSFKELVSSRNSPGVPAHRGKGLYEVLNFVKGFGASMEFSSGSFIASVDGGSSDLTLKSRAHIEGALIKLVVPIV